MSYPHIVFGEIRRDFSFPFRRCGVQRGIFKKLTYEDKFDRNYACWVKNNPRGWAWWKKKNRKEARQKLKKELRSVIDEQ